MVEKMAKEKVKKLISQLLLPFLTLLILLIFIFSLSACSSKPQKYMLSKDELQKERTKEKTGLANPATMFCMNQSGNSWSVKEDDSGSQYGICSFSDGSSCEEWAYYRGNCEPGLNLTKCKGQFWGKAVCPSEYSPVCARIKVNQSNNIQLREETFSNSCNACLFSSENEIVLGYNTGRCK